jgi:hypothetical protein
MTSGALPSGSAATKRQKLVWCAAIVGASALGWWGCTENSPMAPSRTGVHLQADNSQDDSDPNKPPLINGGGRVDFPPGGPTKNDKPYYQEFAFHFRIKKDNSVDGQLNFTDHRTEMQIGGKPFRVDLVAATSFTPTDPDSQCAQGGGVVAGTVVTRNDGSQHSFQLKVCDNGEPGKNAPWDRFYLSINGYTDPNTGEPYNMHHHPTEEGSGAYLTGGNLQAKRV